MPKINLCLKELGFITDTEHCEVNQSASGYKFPPLKKINVAIQKIVEGSLLAEIELDPIPEYGFDSVSERDS
ncbi:MAG: hypothetical protein ABJN98_18895 [Roseibium sp.]